MGLSFVRLVPAAATAALFTACIFFAPLESSPAGLPHDESLPPMPAEWERTLDLSSLPALQNSLGGSADLDWRFANAALGGEVWIEAPDGRPVDDAVLDVPLTDSGWPRSLPAGCRVSLRSYYSRKAPPPAGALRSESAQALTGLHVVAWKGRTLPGGRIEILDLTNDGDPAKGTIVLSAGPNRAVVKVRDPERGVHVSYTMPDPADPVRDVAIWTPVRDGAGLEVDLSRYDHDLLGPGRLGAWCLEPVPGVEPPLWHPIYLEHLRQDRSGAMRFMGWLRINETSWDEQSISWADRMPAGYTLTSLSGISSLDWVRRRPRAFRGSVPVPYEWIFRLCRDVGKDAWIQVPHLASDDHIEGLARLAAREMPGRRVWFEFSNELWNGAAAYLPQWRAAEAAGLARGKSQAWGSGFLQGRALRLFERAWMTAGGADDRLVNVASGWAASPSYNAEVLDGMSDAAPGAAEVLAVTTYFGHDATRALHELDWEPGHPAPVVYEQARELLRAGIYRDFEAWRANAALARERRLGLVAYEGGSHVTALGYGHVADPVQDAANARFMEFLANLHKHPVMRDLYLEHWALWCAAGGRTASLFVDIGGYGFFGYWGAKEDVTETPDAAPRWQAALDFADAQKEVRALGDPRGTAPSFAAGRSFRAEVGIPFHLALQAQGGEGPLEFAFLGGSLPRGTSGDADYAARVQGLPTDVEVSRFVVRVTDRDGDPDYGIFRVAVDPRGAGSGRLVLFDTAELANHRASAEACGGVEGYRTRFDAQGETFEDGAGGLPRLVRPLDPDAPLFARHFADPSIVLPAGSALAPSGGWILSSRADRFAADHPGVVWDGSRDEALAWIGLRGVREGGGGFLEGRVGNAYRLTESERAGVPTVLDAVFLWRKDQFGASGPVSFGTGEDGSYLSLETDGLGADAALIRFVVKDSGSWYVSEAASRSVDPGRFALSGFSASDAAGKRWARFHPEATAFAPPLPDAVPPGGYAAVDFRNVEAVGFALRMEHGGWHYTFALSRFMAVGRRP